jgi:hypothetical protein
VPEVSHSCACIGSPCLKHCVHGAAIGGTEPLTWRQLQKRKEAEKDRMRQEAFERMQAVCF